MSKKLLIGFVVAFFFTLGIFGFGYLWWQDNTQPPSTSTTPISFVVSRGEVATSVIRHLKEKNLIKSELVAKIYLKLHQLDSRIKPGAYLVSQSLTTPQLFELLTSGPKDIWVTFPEGWRREQIAARLQSVIISFDAAEFVRISQSHEGFLFPDTYLVPAQATPSGVLTILLTNFSKKTLLNPPSPKDRETVILASLIEREAKSDPERPTIAGILSKRLEAGWPLQIDATVQYAQNSKLCQSTPIGVCDWWKPVTDTKFPSTYNTYLHPGLPPGPIASPGLASIKAAEAPVESPYWFYIHDSQGTIHYAKDLNEHNFNVDKYLSP